MQLFIYIYTDFVCHNITPVYCYYNSLTLKSQFIVEQQHFTAWSWLVRKEIFYIHEKFGDGIMSAIDFYVDVQKEEAPEGDRVVITLNGKFLPYKVF